MRWTAFALAALASAWAVAEGNDPARTAGKAPAANPGACYTIASPDPRNLCRARATGDTSACYAIMDADLRAYCRATVGGR
jgi:uncharacterized membrane protein